MKKKVSMIKNKISFYDDFKCIASKCSDSCCEGWDVYIDEESVKKYRTCNLKIGEKIRDELKKDEYGYKFALDEKMKCPFLNDDGLCELILNADESILCNICSEHPRFYNFYGRYRECGLGLCCEEVSRLLLESGMHIFITSENSEENFEEIDEFELEDADALYKIRTNIMSIIKSKNTKLVSKLIKIDKIAKKSNLDFFNIDYDAETLCLYENHTSLVSVFSETEAIDMSWYDYIAKMKNFIQTEDFSEKIKNLLLNFSLQIDNIYLYLFYRYFIEMSFKYDILMAVEFINYNLIIIILMIASKNCKKKENFIEPIKYWSKQIEYDEDNIEFLMKSIREKLYGY